MFKPLFWWVSARVSPSDPKSELGIDPEKPILYVLPSDSYIDFIALCEICEKYHLPVPSATDSDDLESSGGAAVVALKKPTIGRMGRLSYHSEKFNKLLRRLKKNKSEDVQVVPVSIFWGRHPGKEEKSIFKLLFSHDEDAGALQKLLIVIAHGRNGIVRFGKATSLQSALERVTDPVDAVSTKLQRVLRLYFRRERDMVLGEKLYDRARIINRIVQSATVRRQIEAQGASAEKIYQETLKARSYADEIAADMTYSVVEAFRLILGWLWNKLYDGVEVKNVETVQGLANKKYEIVYVSNHRSHLDYLLMNHSLYESDLPTPHTGAGINLNFFPIGGVLRKAGAFFMRRSFRGNRLYTVVFNEYLHYLLTNGYPVSFFPEAGRSRTGRLRQPKSGFLSMVVHSYLRDSTRPIALVPVHINYDKVVEVGSYIKELGGDKKRKENVFRLFSSLSILRRYWGKAYINFGDPLVLGDHIGKMDFGAEKRQVDFEEKPPWFSHYVEDLVKEMMVRINNASRVTPISLISFALLASQHKALPEDELLNFCETTLAILRKLGYSDRLVLPEGDFTAQLKTAEKLSSFQRFAHIGGDIIHLTDLDRILVVYYRNNILHLLALPSLIARVFSNTSSYEYEQLISDLSDVYPFLKSGYFLPWEGAGFNRVVDSLLDTMVELGLLVVRDGSQRIYAKPQSGTAAYDNLDLLGNALGNVFDCFAITAVLLTQRDLEGGGLKLETFVSQAHKMAQRITILNGVSIPGSSQGDIFGSYLKALEQNHFITISGQVIQRNESLFKLAETTKRILSPDMRHCVEKVVHATK
jgi:glycerol-3-phosphate O-acyltransferase